IDISAHRPHPPGYIGYVLVGRLLNRLFHNENTSLVTWNVLAASIAIAAFAVFARQVASEEPHPSLSGLAAAIAMLTRPLFWFYNDVAEIYTSELLVSFLVAYC